MELLVVITIIAVLAALIFPVFGRARESAEAAGCVSNLRNLGAEFSRYLNDEGNRVLPISWASTEQKLAFGLPYTGGFMDYYYGTQSTDNQKVFGCGTQRRNKRHIWGNSKPSVDLRRTYSMNTLVTTGPGGAEPRFVTDVSDPGGVIIFGDGDNSDSGGKAGYYNSILNTSRIPEPVHGGSANVLFLDGHVRSIRKADIPTAAEAKVVGSAERMFWYGLNET